MSTIKANQWLNPDNTENYKCRAWVNFNGTGTVAIRASGNVSSITDNGVGVYTVNFTTAMPDANYCATISSAENATAAEQGSTEGHGKVIAHTPASCGVVTYFHVVNVATRPHDSALISVAIFR